MENDIWIRPAKVLEYKNFKVKVDSFGAIFDKIPVLQIASFINCKVHFPVLIGEQGLLLSVFGSKLPVFLRGVYSAKNLPKDIENITIDFGTSKILIKKDAINIKADKLEIDSKEKIDIKADKLNINAKELNIESSSSIKLDSGNIDISGIKIVKGVLTANPVVIKKFFSTIVTTMGATLLSVNGSLDIKENIKNKVNGIESNLDEIKSEIEKINLKLSKKQIRE